MKKFLTIADATYAYEDEGDGDALILLHGFTGTSSTWNPFISLLKQDYRVISIDLPGHGDTKMSTPRTMKQFAQDLNQIIEQLNISSFHLLGYSLGGRAALSYAMYFPGNIQSLLLESASPGLKTVSEQTARKMQDEKLAQFIIEEGLTAFVNYWENIPLFHTQKTLPNRVREAIRAERLSQSPTGLAASLRNMGTGCQPSWWLKISNCSFPLLLIVGEKDKKFVAINEEMATKIKQAKLEVVPNAGHAVHLEQPEKFASVVMEFLAKY